MESHDSEFAAAGGYGPSPAQLAAQSAEPARIWESGYMVADDAQRQAADAAKSGHDIATQQIIGLADAGASPERIADLTHDESARLLSEAESPDAQALARAYDSAAAALTAELTQEARTREGAAPMAARVADGTPHPNAQLAAKGWQAQGGTYIRVPQARPREAQQPSVGAKLGQLYAENLGARRGEHLPPPPQRQGRYPGDANPAAIRAVLDRLEAAARAGALPPPPQRQGRQADREAG